MIGLTVPAFGSALAEIGHYGHQPVAIDAQGEWRRALEEWAVDEDRYLAHLHGPPMVSGPPDRQIGDHDVVDHIANKEFDTLQEVFNRLNVYVPTAWKVRMIESKKRFLVCYSMECNTKMPISQVQVQSQL